MRDLYISMIGLSNLLQPKICGPILGIHIQISHRHMNMGIGMAVQFPEKEYINGIFVAVQPLRILSFLHMIKGLCHGSWASQMGRIYHFGAEDVKKIKPKMVFFGFLGTLPSFDPEELVVPPGLHSSGHLLLVEEDSRDLGPQGDLQIVGDLPTSPTENLAS
jgi:hypothetical protein